MVSRDGPGSGIPLLGSEPLMLEPFLLCSGSNSFREIRPCSEQHALVWALTGPTRLDFKAEPPIRFTRLSACRDSDCELWGRCKIQHRIRNLVTFRIGLEISKATGLDPASSRRSSEVLMVFA
jgi:hypothetical protein